MIARHQATPLELFDIAAHGLLADAKRLGEPIDGDKTLLAQQPQYLGLPALQPRIGRAPSRAAGQAEGMDRWNALTFGRSVISFIKVNSGVSMIG